MKSDPATLAAVFLQFATLGVDRRQVLRKIEGVPGIIREQAFNA